MKVCHISWLTNYFSVACSAVWQHFIHLSKLESSQILKLLHQLILCNILKSFVVISTVFTASLPGVDSISRNYFLRSSIRSNFFPIGFIIKFQQFTSSGSTLNASSHYFHHICSYVLYWSLIPLKVIQEDWNQLTNSCECWYFDLFPWLTNVLSGI